jgi:hypothetical protein
MTSEGDRAALEDAIEALPANAGQLERVADSKEYHRRLIESPAQSVNGLVP